MNSNFIRTLALAAFLAAGFSFAQAQTAVTTDTVMSPSGTVAVHMGGEGMGFQFVSGEPATSGRLVVGAPYSLDATIEAAQTLSDGNRIVHRQTVHLYRDSKGRTRREETLAAIGPWAASGTPPTMITIHDPVSGLDYILDPQQKTATKVPSLPPLPPLSPGKQVVVMRDAEAGVTTSTGSSAPVAGQVAAAGEGPDVVFGFNTRVSGQMLHPEEKSESLGKETIAGLSADGTRTTTTIPANAIGNERPLDVVRDRWYASDLQIVLRSKQTDPRFGETTYEVTRLDRDEPTSSLFEIPADYKLVEGKSHMYFKSKTAPR